MLLAFVSVHLVVVWWTAWFYEGRVTQKQCWSDIDAVLCFITASYAIDLVGEDYYQSKY